MKQKKKSPAEKLTDRLERLAAYFEKANLADYINTIHGRPGKLLLLNFLSGVSRGFGIAVGLTAVFGIAIYILTKMIDLPIIGQHIAEIVKMVNFYLNKGMLAQ